jgi:hypothetical protein
MGMCDARKYGATDGMEDYMHMMGSGEYKSRQTKAAVLFRMCLETVKEWESEGDLKSDVRNKW